MGVGDSEDPVAGVGDFKNFRAEKANEDIDQGPRNTVDCGTVHHPAKREVQRYGELVGRARVGLGERQRVGENGGARDLDRDVGTTGRGASRARPTPPKVANAFAAAVPTTELFAEQLVCTLTGTGELTILGLSHPMTPTVKLAAKAAWADRVATDSAAARATRNKDRMTLAP